MQSDTTPQPPNGDDRNPLHSANLPVSEHSSLESKPIQPNSTVISDDSPIILPPDGVGDSPSAAARSQLQLLTRKQRSKYSQQYVVMDRHRTTVVQVPGTGQPFCSTRKKHVESVATEVGGVCETLLDAIELVASSPCNFPKDSKHYDPRRSAPKLKWMFTKGKSGGFGV